MVHDGLQVRYPCEMNEVADAPLRSLRLDIGATQRQCSIGLEGEVAGLRLCARVMLHELVHICFKYSQCLLASCEAA
jgi:hypothetical protein